jgi:CheY-like chemotaxis protein
MSIRDRPAPPSAIAGLAALLALVFLLDLFTRLGVAVWEFYLVPLALTLLLRSPALPLGIAAAITLLIGIGYVVSPRGADVDIAAINRAFGILIVWLVAALARWLILSRQNTMRLAWLQEGQAQVARSTLGEQSVEVIADRIVTALCRYLDADVGAMYRMDADGLVRIGGYALDDGDEEVPVPRRLALGQGLAGQAARDGIARSLAGLPDGHLRIGSALGHSAPVRVLVAPFTADGAINGVIEIGSRNGVATADLEVELMRQCAESIGLPIRSALYRARLVELLEETQRQSEQLRAQQEELESSNEELEEQSQALQASQTRLERQQEDLLKTNARLEEQAERLESQRRDLVLAQDSLIASADALRRASRYKSEFLANMSHELRTPLNSSLILSSLLADNRGANLTEEQVRHARAIREANESLLDLINDILDLSKIEAGHADIEPVQVTMASVLDSLRQVFGEMAAQKSLQLVIESDPATPERIVTDSRRLQQVLRNLLSNAIKFTERGSVSLQVKPARRGRLRFTVTDTGIGIDPALHETIFEAFRQADGSTSRRFGGTGLGLSISRELARLLGGTLSVRSAPGEGSAFTLELPLVLEAPDEAAGSAGDLGAPAIVGEHGTGGSGGAHGSHGTNGAGGNGARGSGRAARNAAQPAPAPDPIPDDRNDRLRGQRLILVVEDDPGFARILYDLAHEQDFDCVHATNGADAIALAKQLMPAGILLDVGLPDRSGLSVLEALKRDPATRHLPIHVVSISEHSRTALELGAIGYALKPAERTQLQDALGRIEARLERSVRRVLVVEDEPSSRDAIAALLRSDTVELVAVGTIADALRQLGETPFDCMVMDLALPDGSGFELLDRMAASGGQFPPVVVYTGRALSRDDEQRLRRHAGSIIVKGARSPERLLDEVTLFLHMIESELPEHQRRMLEQVRLRDAAFEGRRVLLVDDDARTIFALSSVIEPLGAAVEIARNGREALERLKADPDGIDLVLMDIMMPEMDGLTAITEIRKLPAHARLPVIALTARAMPDDRSACLQAGANDYVAKPVDIDRLVSLMRVWMPK